MRNFVKKHPSSWRYISVFMILVLILPPIFLTAFAGQIGAYVGFASFALIAIIGIYEIFSNFQISKLSSLYLSLLPLLMFFLPWDEVVNVANYSNSGNDILAIAINRGMDWRAVTTMILGSFIPLIIDPKFRKNSNVLIKQTLIIVILIIVSIFTKTIWIMNKLTWDWMLFFLSIAIFADTFGYLGGKYFGKKLFNGAKLAPSISPKKTWAGFMIAYVITAIFIGIVGWYMHVFGHTNNELIYLISVAILFPIISPMGDLFFSWIKRLYGIKDFSNLIPGHGGIMDRLDAMSIIIFSTALIYMISLL